jgi:hypothetical protein
MQEVLSKPGWEETPIDQIELFELALEEMTDPERPFVVRRTRYEWDPEISQIVPVEHILDQAKTLKDAEDRYAVHLKILAHLGFVCSDMDPIM